MLVFAESEQTSRYFNYRKPDLKDNITNKQQYSSTTNKQNLMIPFLIEKGSFAFNCLQSTSHIGELIWVYVCMWGHIHAAYREKHLYL